MCILDTSVFAALDLLEQSLVTLEERRITSSLAPSACSSG